VRGTERERDLDIERERDCKIGSNRQRDRFSREETEREGGESDLYTHEMQTHCRTKNTAKTKESFVPSLLISG